MQCQKLKTYMETGRVVFLPAQSIQPNPAQPRKVFAAGALDELAESIRQHGILQPLSVRRRDNVYELISGERRLRAAQLAGVTDIPCILMRMDDLESGMAALVENLQRQDLDFIEEAQAIQRMIRLFGLSQEEAARRLGRSQSAVANKLRLLKLPEDVLDRLRSAGLTERHARALLRLETPEDQRAALEVILARELNVAGTDRYIDSLLQTRAAERKAKRRTFLMKDVRLFLNSVEHNLDVMKRSGIPADMETRETEDALILTISIPKKREEQAG